MLKKLLLALLFLAIAHTTIVITSPLQTGFPNNELNYLYVNFGEIPYSKTLTFDLFITDKQICDNNDLQHFTKPTYVVVKTDVYYSCSLTKRALIAQANGAKGIVFASTSYDYAVGKVHHGDDGNGKRVHITSLMISNQDFQKLKNLKNVEIIANFPIPTQTKSTISIFLSSSKRSSYVFLRQLSEHYKFLKNYTDIDVIYQTVICQSCSSSNCLMQTYCCYDYENYKYDVGQKIILQQLHQYQIFKQRGVEQWLQYMDLFDEYCISNWYVVDGCVKKIMSKLNMKEVNSMLDPEDTLNEWNSKETELGFDSFPEVAINGMIYQGNFDTDQIVEAICDSLTAPPQYCIDGTTIEPAKNKNHMSIILLVTVVSIIVVGLIVVCIYRKFIKKQLTNDMVSKVGELVANYANKVSKQKIRQKQKFIEAHDQQL